MLPSVKPSYMLMWESDLDRAYTLNQSFKALHLVKQISKGTTHYHRPVYNSGFRFGSVFPGSRASSILDHTILAARLLFRSWKIQALSAISELYCHMDFAYQMENVWLLDDYYYYYYYSSC